MNSYDDLITEDLLDALRGQESADGKYLVGPQTKSGEHALGPYQFMSATWEQYKPSKDADVMDEADARAGARKMLTAYLKHYDGDIELALAGYNHGMGNVDKAIARARNRGLDPTFENLAQAKLIPEQTRDYVPGIAGRLKKKEPESSANLDEGRVESDFGFDTILRALPFGDVLAPSEVEADDNVAPTTKDTPAPAAAKIDPANLPEIKSFQGTGSLEQFKSAVYEQLTSPLWPQLPADDRMDQLSKIIDSGYWDSDVWPVVKQLSTNIWAGAPLEARPDLNALIAKISPVPQLDEKKVVEPQKELDAWGENLKSTMRAMRVVPEIFGDQLDEHIEQAKRYELEAFGNRKGGFVHGAKVGAAYTSRFLSGVTSAFGAVPAAAARYAGVGMALSGNPSALLDPTVRKRGEQVAEGIEAVSRFPDWVTTKLVGDPSRINAMQDEKTGRVIENEFGEPLPAHPTIEGLTDLAGNVAGMFMMGGGTYKLFSKLGQAQAVAASLGTNTAVGMNMAYHETKAEGGTDDQAWAAGLASIPGSALQAVVTHFVASGAPPALLGLSRRQQIRNLASWSAKNLVLGEGPAMSAQQLWQSSMASIALGKVVVTTDKLKEAYFAGVLGGAVGKFALAKTKLNQVKAIEQDIRRLETFVNDPKFQPPKAGIETAIPEQSEDGATSEGQKFVVTRPLNAQEQRHLGERLQSFLDSDAQNLNLSVEEAAHLPEFIVRNAGVTVAPDEAGASVTLTKKSTFVPSEPGTTIESLDESIKNVRAYLEQHPSAASEEEILSEYYQLKSQLRESESGYGRAYRDALARRTTLKADYESAQQLVEEAQRSRNKTEIEAAKKMRSAAMEALNAHDAAYEPRDKAAWAKFSQMDERLSQLRSWVQLITEGKNSAYPGERSIGVIENDRRNAERHLEYLLGRRGQLVAEAELNGGPAREYSPVDKKRRLLLNAAGLERVPSNVDLSRGVSVGGKVVMPYNGKWYVMNRAGVMSHARYDSYFDAVRSLEPERVVAKPKPEVKPVRLIGRPNEEVGTATYELKDGKLELQPPEKPWTMGDAASRMDARAPGPISEQEETARVTRAKSLGFLTRRGLVDRISKALGIQPYNADKAKQELADANLVELFNAAQAAADELARVESKLHKQEAELRSAAGPGVRTDADFQKLMWSDPEYVEASANHIAAVRAYESAGKNAPVRVLTQLLGRKPDELMTWYHGSADIKFDRFKTKHLGGATGADSAHEAIFLSSLPEDATDYANGSFVSAKYNRVEEILQRLADTASDPNARQSTRERADKHYERIYNENRPRKARGIIPAHVRVRNPMIVDNEGAGFGHITADIRKAKRLGHDAVIFFNIEDPNAGATHIAVFDPAQIRSKFAAFATERSFSARLDARASDGAHSEKPVYTSQLEQFSDGQVDIDTLADTPPADAAVPISHDSLRRLTRSIAKKPLTSLWTPDVHHPMTGDKMVKTGDVIRQIHGMMKDLGKNMTALWGGRMPKNVAGYIMYLNDLIKVGRFGDVQTFIHEAVGHLVDAVKVSRWNDDNMPDYSDVPPNVQTALIDHYETFYGTEGEPMFRQLKEGMAMFFQHYMTDQPVRKEVLDWYHSQFSEQHPELYKQLESLHETVYDYYNQKSELFTEQHRAEEKTPLQKVAQSVSRASFVDRWINDAASLGEMDYLIEKGSDGKYKVNLLKRHEFNKFRPAYLADNFMRGTLADFYGNFEYYGQDTRDLSNVEQIFSGLKSAEAEAIRRNPNDSRSRKVENFVSAMNAARSLTLFFQGHEPSLNYHDALKTFKTHVADPDIQRAMRKYYELIGLLQHNIAQSSPSGWKLVDSWQRSAREALHGTALEDAFPTLTHTGLWVPFQREGMGPVKSFKKTQGSTRPPVDFRKTLENSVRTLYAHAARQADFHGLMLAWDLPGHNPIGGYIREVTGQKMASIKDELIAQTDALIRSGQGDTEGISNAEAKNAANFFNPWYKLPTDSRYSYFSVYDPAKKQLRYFETDPRVYQAIQGGLPDHLQKLASNPWTRWLWVNPGRVLRLSATTFMLPFQIKQFMRDPVTAWKWMETEGLGAVDALKLAHHIIAATQDATMFNFGKHKDGWYARFARMGLTHMTRIGTENALYRETAGKLPGQMMSHGPTFLNLLESFGSIPEMATRTAVARLVAEKMGITDPNQKISSLEAIEIGSALQRCTTNFGRQGSTARFWNMGVPFFSARINELSRMPDDLRRNRYKVGGVAVASLMLGIMHAIAHDDKKWYRETDIPTKMNTAWLELPIGGGVTRPFGIPLDSWTSLFWGPGQMIGNAMSKDPNLKPGIVEMAKAYFGQNISPINSKYDLLGVLGKEVVAQLSNQDLYFDRPIVPSSMQYKEKTEQYTDYTTEFSKKVAKLMQPFGKQWSPMKIDHAIRAAAPAAFKALGWTEKAVGLKSRHDEPQAFWVATAMNLLPHRVGTSNTVMDRSSRLFYDRLLTARTNKYKENAQEMELRKKLEKLNTHISRINIVLRAEFDQQSREELKKMKDNLLNLGLTMARGEKAGVPSSAGKYDAKAQRLQKQNTAKERAEALLLRGSTESE